jgi:hypothetical protein
MTKPTIQNPRASPVKWRTPVEVREETNPQQDIHGGRWGGGQAEPKVAPEEPTLSESPPDVARRQGHLARWDEEGGMTERSQ